MSTAGQIVGGVVGTVVGAFVGYPMLGAQIGLMIGGYLDPPKQKINRPTTDLSVQTATYGTPVGTGYGNYATFGNVFWVRGNKLDLVEGDDGGKGGGDEPTPDKVYGTFAIGFGEGEIAGFGRIWCNGKLVSDPTSSDTGAMLATAAVDALMTAVTTPKGQGLGLGGGGDGGGGMRFYLGTDDQLPDPSIQADMGAAYTPGYRGLRYIVFVNWPMEDYGNTLMGLQVKAEILNSATVDQYARLSFVENLLPDTNTFPGANAEGLEFGYFNPRIDNGLFTCDKNSEQDGYTYHASISHEGILVSGGLATGLTNVPVSGTFGYVGRAPAGDVIYDSTGYTGNFLVGANVFKTKVVDTENTCHGMAVGIDGRIYALERVAAAWQFNIYDGTTLDLISSGVNYAIRLGDGYGSLPCIPGTPVTFAVESDGVHVWLAASAGETSALNVCSISAIGDLSVDHAFSPTTESHLSEDGRFAAIYADGGICGGVSDHGDFFMFSRVQVLGPTAVPLADIIEARCLLSGLLTAGDLDLSEITQTVRGYRVHEVTSIRASLEPLQGAFPFDIIPSGYQIAFKPRGASPVATIDIGECGCVAGNEKTGDILTQSREMDSQLPVKVQVTYFDVNREYDHGTGPGAMRLNTDAVNIQNIDMPIVLNANEAAGIEEVLLYMYWMERTEFKFVLPPTRRNLEPADVITLTAPGASYELRLTEINDLPDGRMECSARPNNPAVYTPTAQGQEGQSTGQILSYPGSTLFRLLDLPCVDDTYMNTLGAVVAMDGYSSGWPGATLYGSQDNGTTWGAIESLVAPGSVLGELVAAPQSGRSDIVDHSATLTARFYSAVSLASLTLPQFYAEGNAFAIGSHGRWEIICARAIVENADGTWTFSDMMRGRYGTEHNTGSHAVGDSVVMLDPARLEFIGMSSSAIGVQRLYAGVTLRQTLDPNYAQAFTYTAENFKPLPPIHIKGAKNSSGNWSFEWTPRSRLPVEPFSGSPTPLGESAESYQVEIWNSSWTTLVRTIVGLTSPSATYTNAQQVEDFGAVQKLMYVRVYQISTTVGRGYAGQAVCGNLALLNVRSLIHFDDTPAVTGRVLGLHCDGTNGSTTFTDVAGKTITANGNAQISTAQYPPLTGKTSSAYFDGTGDYLSTPNSSDFDLGTGDFTLSVWYYSPTGATYNANVIGLICAGRMETSASAGGWNLHVFDTSPNFSIRLEKDLTTGTTVVYQPNGTGTVSRDAWHCVECCRASGITYMFHDGTLLGSSSIFSGVDLPVPNSLSIIFGGGGPILNPINYPMSGYLSEIEVLKGAARHTASYSLPTLAFSDSGQQISDGAQNTITIVGTAVTVDNAASFGGRCLQANQSSGYVSTPVIPLTEEYWTIDLWVTADALPSSSYMGILDYGTGADGIGGLCAVIRYDGLPMVFFDYAVPIEVSTLLSAGERAHVFIQRSGSSFYMGAKGIVGSNRDISTTSFVGDKGFRIGYANVTYPETRAIKIDEFRVFSGEAKYPLSGTYVIPTTPFPDL